METFGTLKVTLEDLERSSFARLDESFKPSGELGNCINGDVQFFVLDEPRKAISLELLPVVCAIGINYTQKRGQFSGKLRPLFAGRPSPVIHNTRCREATSYVIAAYNRNIAAWANRYPSEPSSPGDRGAPQATAAAGLLDSESKNFRERFNLIMTNVSPFITQKKWSDQVKSTPDSCIQIVADSSHLDTLYERLGPKVDLWIGHNANGGETWVRPEFARFLKRHNIRHWITTGNISPLARLQFEHKYREETHPRFPWFGPQRS